MREDLRVSVVTSFTGKACTFLVELIRALVISNPPGAKPFGSVHEPYGNDHDDALQ
ncbi:hypothetical protein D3C84_1143700 [compost metagenome]